MNDRTFPIPSNTISVKSEDYTNKSLQMDSNPFTMKASKTPAIESSDQTKAANKKRENAFPSGLEGKRNL